MQGDCVFFLNEIFFWGDSVWDKIKRNFVSTLLLLSICPLLCLFSSFFFFYFLFFLTFFSILSFPFSWSAQFFSFCWLFSFFSDFFFFSDSSLDCTSSQAQTLRQRHSPERRRILHPSWSWDSLWSRAGKGTTGPMHKHPPRSNIFYVIRKALISYNISNIRPALRIRIKPFQIHEASDSQGWPPENRAKL